MNSLDKTGIITKFWQRNYYEHVIRNEHDMVTKWNYIASNPGEWGDDDENPIQLTAMHNSIQAMEGWFSRTKRNIR